MSGPRARHSNATGLPPWNFKQDCRASFSVIVKTRVTAHCRCSLIFVRRRRRGDISTLSYLDITFSIALMIYDCFRVVSPAYIGVFHAIRSVHRSSPSSSLAPDCAACSDCETVSYCPRSFRVVVPQIWNTLPSHLGDSVTL